MGQQKFVLDWKHALKVSKQTNKLRAVDNALQITYNNEHREESSYFFESFAYRENYFDLLTRMINDAASLRVISEPSTYQPVPPDETLKKLSIAN